MIVSGYERCPTLPCSIYINRISLASKYCNIFFIMMASVELRSICNESVLKWDVRCQVSWCWCAWAGPGQIYSWVSCELSDQRSRLTLPSSLPPIIVVTTHQSNTRLENTTQCPVWRHDRLRVVSQLSGPVARPDRNKSALQSLQCQPSQSIRLTKEKCQ